jgi:hypothetical protein
LRRHQFRAACASRIELVSVAGLSAVGLSAAGLSAAGLSAAGLRPPDDPLGGQVDGQVAEPDPGRRLGRRGAPHRRAHPGQQLVHAERLGQVIVGPGVERFHLVRGVGPAGQHDDRRGSPAAQPADHVHAVHVGQSQVEDDQVRRVGGGQRQRLRPGLGRVHRVLPRPQVDPQRPQDLRLIVNNKHPGHWSPSSQGGSAPLRPPKPCPA